MYLHMIDIMTKFKIPMSYPLNRENVKKFIAASAPDARDTVRKFMKAIKHVSFETFIHNINRNLKEVIKDVPSDRPLFVLIDIDNHDDYMYKSNYWIFLYIQEMTKKLYKIDTQYVNTIDDTKIQTYDVILLVDDCIYTGTQMSTTIDTMKNTFKKNLTIILFASYMSKSGLDLIIESKKENKELNTCLFDVNKYVHYIDNLQKYVSSPYMKDVLYYYRPQYEKYDRIQRHRMLLQDAAKELQKYPIYFDHKAADHISTFPLMYSGLVPNENNRNLMAQIGVAEAEKKYDIFPLIKNCEHITKRSIGFIFNCPKPPYKKGYSKFIDILRKFKTHKSASLRRSKMSLEVAKMKSPARRSMSRTSSTTSTTSSTKSFPFSVRSDTTGTSGHSESSNLYSIQNVSRPGSHISSMSMASSRKKARSLPNMR